MTTWADIEGRLYSDLTPGQKLWVLRQPGGARRLARYARHQARRITALPGDVFQDFARDIYIVVHSGRPGHVKGYRITGQLVAALGVPVEDALEAALADPRCDVVLERVTLP